MQRKIILMFFIVFGLFITTIKAQPDAPKNLKATVDTTGQFLSVKLTWDSVSIPGRMTMMRYVIYKKWGSKTDSGKFYRQLFKLEQNSYIDRFVLPGKTYSYFVTTIDSSRQESKHSDTASVIIAAPPVIGYVSGTIRDSITKQAVKNARVALIPVTGFHFNETKIDTSGKFTIGAIPGTYILFINAPSYRGMFYGSQPQTGGGGIKSATRIKISSGDTVKNISIVLYNPQGQRKLVTISGTVTDSSGKVVQARVRALILNNRFFRHNFANAQTDTSGRYQLKVMSGDTLILNVQPANGNYQSQFYNNKSELFEADRIAVMGDTTYNFVLTARQVYTNKISGHVTGLDSLGTTRGIPASVTAFRLRETSAAKSRISVLTDSVGNYSITNLVPGKYILLAVPAEGYLPTFYRVDSVQTLRWRDADSITVTDNSPIANINFVTHPVPDSGFTTIAGTVKSNTGQAVGGALVTFMDVNKVVAGYTFTDANGNYRLPTLSPGTYTVETDKFNYTGTSMANVTVNYTSSTSQTVNLTLTPLIATGVSDKNTVIKNYALEQNYPNPFNPTTTINFQIPTAGMVTLKVYNSIGQEVATLVNEFKSAGKYSAIFDARNLSSGVYFYRIIAGNYQLSHKMVLLK
ncbi:MAG: carboxypeptidase regulatory-like domain-containing protein [Bacteroidota bacterium]|nr:carboxypeptidase regulatory-like domain-containing protein [Bacteroidota bacterium]MDP4195364.1 carboxypeptidase regulatory-like domain-containing protein [Bacteroidota bacterium]